MAGRGRSSQRPGAAGQGAAQVQADFQGAARPSQDGGASFPLFQELLKALGYTERAASRWAECV